MAHRYGRALALPRVSAAPGAQLHRPLCGLRRASLASGGQSGAALGCGFSAGLGLGLASAWGYTTVASAEAAPKTSIKLACIQLSVGPSKEVNLKNAYQKISEAKAAGAGLVMLPEIFNHPYGNDHFPKYAETLPSVGDETPINKELSPSAATLQAAAKYNGVYLVGGSVSEKVAAADGSEKLYNTSLVFSPDGVLLAKHRKVHLFDVDIPDQGFRFMESDTLTPGSSLTDFEMEPKHTGLGAPVKVGLAICYDIRFPEMASIAAEAGCRVMLYPAAFAMATGPHHWELLQRARALDNFMYVATASPARNVGKPGYQAYGHSLVCNPWGKVIAATDEHPGIVYADLDFGQQDTDRKKLPLPDQRRVDLFTTAAPK